MKTSPENTVIAGSAFAALGLSILALTGSLPGSNVNELKESQEQLIMEVRDLSRETAKIRAEMAIQSQTISKMSAIKAAQDKARAENLKRIKAEFKKKPLMTYKVAPYKASEAEIMCLAKNIYHEAAFEGRVGMLSVGHVTMNRLEKGTWGKNLCKVIYSPNQYSWTRSKQLLSMKPRGEAWEASQRAAKQTINGMRIRGLEKSLHYHAMYIKSPSWAKNMKLVHVVGEHIFFNS